MTSMGDFWVWGSQAWEREIWQAVEREGRIADSNIRTAAAEPRGMKGEVQGLYQGVELFRV